MTFPDALPIRSLRTLRHALQPGEAEQAALIFRRNTALAELYPGDLRAAYAATAAQAPLAEGTRIEPVACDTAHGWWVRPANPDPERAIFFVHGGGYRLGDAKSYLGFVSQIAARTGCTIFSADYRRAPEHPFPAAHEDVRRARDWFASQGFSQYAAIGDSAGGGLVLSIAAAPTTPARLASMVVFSPWTDLSNSAPSFRDPATVDPIFEPAILDGLARGYLDGADAHDPRASPLYGTLQDLPPINIQVGSNERLLDDALRLAEQTAEHAVPTRLDVFEGLYHVFQRDVGALKTADSALEIAARFVAEHWE